MTKKWSVDIDEYEEAELVALTQKGSPCARKIKRASILLLANAGKPDFEIAGLLHSSWLNITEVEISDLTDLLDTLKPQPATARASPYQV